MFKGVGSIEHFALRRGSVIGSVDDDDRSRLHRAAKPLRSRYSECVSPDAMLYLSLDLSSYNSNCRSGRGRTSKANLNKTLHILSILILVCFNCSAQSAATQHQLYDDKRVSTWAADFLGQKREQVLRSVEQDLRSLSPHPFAPHVWVAAQDSQGNLEKNWRELKDPRLRRALGSLPSIYLDYKLGRYSKLLAEYPSEQADAIKDVWSLHYLAQAAYERSDYKRMLDYAVAMSRLQPSHFQAAWLALAAATGDEHQRDRVMAITKPGEAFYDTLFGRFLNAALNQTPPSDLRLIAAVEPWLRAYPRDARALRFKGLHHGSLAQHESAASLYAVSTASYPFKTVDFPNWKDHAFSLAKLNKLQEAREVVLNSAQFDARNSDDKAGVSALFEQRFASILIAVGEYDAAHRALEAAITRYPDDAGLLDRLASLEIFLNRSVESYAFTNEQFAAGLKPEDFCRAFAYARKAAALAPESLESQLTLLNAYQCVGAARNMYRESNYEHREEILELQRSMLNEAYKLFESLDRRFSEKSQEFFSVGSSILSAMRPLGVDRHDEQVRLCERAVAEFPGSAWMLRELAGALEAAGRNEEALARLNQSFDIEPPNEWAASKYNELVTVTTGAVEARRGLARLLKRFPGNRSLMKLAPFELPRADDPGSASRPVIRLQSGHAQPPISIAWSRDGNLIATGGRRGLGAAIDGTIKLWDAKSRRLLRTLEGHQGGVLSLAFSPDSKSLVSGSSDYYVKVWNVESGELLWQYQRKSMGIGNATFSGHVVAFSPDGRKIVSSGAYIGVLLFEASAGRPLPTSFGGTIAAFHPDGNLVIADYQHRVGLYDSSTGRLIRSYGVARFEVNYVAVSPDGKWVAVGCGRYDTNAIHIWNSETTNPARTIEGNKRSIEYVVFTPDSKHLISYDNSGASKLWDVADKEPARELGPGGIIAFNREGTLGAVIGNDGFQIWNVKDWSLAGVGVGEIEGILKGIFTDSLGLFRAKFSGDGRYILAGGGSRKLVIWDTRSGSVIRTPDVDGNGAQFSPEGEMYVTIGDGKLKLWNFNGTLRNEFGNEQPGVLCADFSPVGAGRIATGTSDGRAMVWDITNTKVPYRILTHPPAAKARDKLPGDSDPGNSQISSVGFSPDGKLLAAGDHNQMVWLWEVETGALLWPKPKQISDSNPPATVNFVKASFKSRANAAPVDIVPTHGTYVRFSPDGKTIAVGTGYPKGYLGAEHLKLLDVATGRVRFSLQGHRAGVTAVVFSHDSRLLVSGSKDNTIGIWNVETGSPIRMLEGHTDDVNSVEISPDGRFILSASDDGSLKLWAMPGNETATAAKGGAKAKSASEVRSKELYTLAKFKDDTWAVVDAEGRFDTNNLENIKGLHWIVPDDPFNPLPLEIFMRDYYEPRLLPRFLTGKEFSVISDVRSLSELNRVQPKIGKITVLPRADNTELVDVKVEASSVRGQCLEGDRHVPCESGVYDLRLYRDGQLVKQSPLPASSSLADSLGEGDWRKQLQQWRDNNVVRTGDGRPVTIATGMQEVTFKGIRLPQRSSVSQVEFTAYAFNKDRIKSATSGPVVYTLQPGHQALKRRAYVITMGVDATSDPTLRLGFAPKGARDFERLLRKRLESEYEFVPISLISEKKQGSDELLQDLATKGNLQTVLKLLSAQGGTEAQRQAFPMLRPATPDDLVVLYIASHGYANPAGKFYVIPSDIGEPIDHSEELLDRCFNNSEQSERCQAGLKFLRDSISSDELSQWLEAVDAGQMVLVLDSCHSAAVSGPNFKPGPMGDRGFGQLSYDKGMLVLAATQAENLAWGSLELDDRSLLTYALINQLQGEAIRSFDFKQWLSEAEQQVPELYAKFIKNGQQSSASESPQQEPTLFDFTRKRTAGNLISR